MGDKIYDIYDRTSEKYEFIAHKKGLHHFCFTNKSPYHETVDFDVQVGHFAYDQHAKDGMLVLTLTSIFAWFICRFIGMFQE